MVCMGEVFFVCVRYILTAVVSGKCQVWRCASRRALSERVACVEGVSLKVRLDFSGCQWYVCKYAHLRR